MSMEETPNALVQGTPRLWVRAPPGLLLRNQTATINFSLLMKSLWVRFPPYTRMCMHLDDG